MMRCGTLIVACLGLVAVGALADHPEQASKARTSRETHLERAPEEFPLGSFLPSPGHSYIDHSFGSVVKVLTGPGLIHPYSLPTPFSAHNKYVLARSAEEGTPVIFDAATGKIAYRNFTYSSDLTVWDARDDDVQYYISGATLMKRAWPRGRETVLVDYSRGPHRFTQIMSGGSSDTSGDNWIALWAPNEHQVCAVNLQLVQTFCADYTASHPENRVGWDFIDYVAISKGLDTRTHKRYVVMMAKPAMGVWSVNMAAGRLDFEYRGPEDVELPGNHDHVCDPGEHCISTPHADLLEDATGKQYLVRMRDYEQPCARQLVTQDLSKGLLLDVPASRGGGTTAVMEIAPCGQPWPDFHVGCAKQAPYCVISTFSNALRTRGDRTTPLPAGPHMEEIMIMRGNGEEIRPIARSRSVLFTDDSYYSTPRAAISPDGSIVVFDSDFGVSHGERLNLVPTGFGQPHGAGTAPNPELR